MHVSTSLSSLKGFGLCGKTYFYSDMPGKIT
jgi:hypothetical protein